MSKSYLDKIRRVLMLAAMVCIVMLAAMSVYAAFIGADRAQSFFNSTPLGFYWFIFIVLLIAGLCTFPRLVKRPFLLMMHLGPLLIILGSLWASPQGHILHERLLGSEVVPNGYLIIHQGQSSRDILSEQEQLIGQLPFNVRLDRFTRHFYEPGKLLIAAPSGRVIELAAEAEATARLNSQGAMLTVLGHFDNLQVVHQEGQLVVIDQPESGGNAALEVSITTPHGGARKFFVYADQQFQHNRPLANWQFKYVRQIRDYISELTVTDKQGRTLHTCQVEVNYPMSFGGYSFYQHSWAMHDGEPVTILSIASQQGVSIVYFGYWLMAIGIIAHFAGKLYKQRVKNKNGG